MNEHVEWIEEEPGTLGAPATLGAINYWCWDSPGFKGCHAAQYQLVQGWVNAGIIPASQANAKVEELAKQNCGHMCVKPAAQPAGPCTAANQKFSAGARALSSHTTAEFAAIEKCASGGGCGDFPGMTQADACLAIKSANQAAVNYTEASKNAPCTDGMIIAHAQHNLGVKADGSWGALSQLAFDASGKTYAELIYPLQCTGNPPKYVPGMEIPPGVVNPPVETPPPVAATTAKKKTPWGLILGLGAAGVATAWFVSEDQKKKRGR